MTNRILSLWAKLALVSLLAAAGCALPHASLRQDGSTGDIVADQVNCGDVAFDPSNCGACGNRCPAAAAGQEVACIGGACVTRCAPGRADCDGNAANGCEVTTATDIANCGACGTRCSSMGGAPVCMAGVCSTSCAAGRGNCDMDLSNGCETDVTNTVAHCGTCGNACPRGANSVSTCSMGTCGITCNTGFADCDMNPANGCETMLGTTSACSRCGEACSGATPICSTTAMRCVDGCGTGETRCGMSCVNTATNVNNCGSCGRACSFPNASATCSMGACQLGPCNPGFANCDGNATNGCETDLGSSNAHCGGCGRACNLMNASSSCMSGSCVIGMCNAGFGNCDGNQMNGCEANFATNPSHCSRCGNACGAAPNATPTCAAGACGIACNTSFGNCDSNVLNGCETNLRDNPANCGACGTACTAAQRCNGTSCANCMPGGLRCPTTGNVCVDVQANNANCGACGTVCAEPTPTCAARVCGSGCTGGLTRCNSMCVNTQTSNSHCGGCSNTCSGGATCGSGTCSCTGRATICGPANARFCCPAGERCDGTGMACEMIPDSGVPPTDTGVPPADTGVPPMDTGVPPADSGVPMDTGAD